MSNVTIQTEPIAVNVSGAAALTGLSESSIWEALRDNELPSQKIKGRRLILVRDLKAWLEVEEEPCTQR